MKETNKQDKKRKRNKKNGIWFNNTESIEYYAQAKAAKIEKIVVFVIAYFNNAFAELSFFLVGFFFTRNLLGETFHLNSTIGCTTFTWTIFYLITALIPSIEISVFLCVLLGTMLSIYMHYIVVKEDDQCQED